MTPSRDTVGLSFPAAASVSHHPQRTAPDRVAVDRRAQSQKVRVRRMPHRPSSLTVASALAAWIGAEEVDCARLQSFYKLNPQYKDVVQGAKAERQRSVKALVALHPDVLSCRTDGTTLYIRKADGRALCTHKEPDSVSELSARLKTLNIITMPVLNDLLVPLKDGESNRQFALKMHAMGVCLKNGQMYGNGLAKALEL